MCEFSKNVLQKLTNGVINKKHKKISKLWGDWRRPLFRRSKLLCNWSTFLRGIKYTKMPQFISQYYVSNIIPPFIYKLPHVDPQKSPKKTPSHEPLPLLFNFQHHTRHCPDSKSIWDFDDPFHHLQQFQQSLKDHDRIHYKSTIVQHQSFLVLLHDFVCQLLLAQVVFLKVCLRQYYQSPIHH